MNGKSKCKALREIRRQIADENDINFVTEECTFKGSCKGTCPRCEAELRYLERELAKRTAIGKAAAVVGITVGATVGLAGCTPTGSQGTTTVNTIEPTEEVLSGDVEYIPDTEQTTVDPDDMLMGEIAPIEVDPEPTEDIDIEPLAGVLEYDPEFDAIPEDNAEENNQN